MSRIDEAIARMDAAVSELDAGIEHALAGEAGQGASTDVPELKSERDLLAEEVKSLRERAEDDARLRAEAATAVRQALNDLRGVVQQGAGHA